MSPATAALVAGFEVAAKAARQDEDAVRKRMVEEVGHLERQRAFAYCKLNLVRTLCAAMASAENEETGVAQGLAVVRAEPEGKDYPERLYYDLDNQIWYEPQVPTPCPSGAKFRDLLVRYRLYSPGLHTSVGRTRADVVTRPLPRQGNDSRNQNLHSALLWTP